jgi:hypothetical protein
MTFSYDPDSPTPGQYSAVTPPSSIGLEPTFLLSIGNSDGEAARGTAMAKSGVKPLIFLIAVSLMAWVAGMAIHGF